MANYDKNASQQYVDEQIPLRAVMKTGDEDVNGIKTFYSLPRIPAAKGMPVQDPASPDLIAVKPATQAQVPFIAKLNRIEPSATVDILSDEFILEPMNLPIADPNGNYLRAPNIGDILIVEDDDGNKVVARCVLMVHPAPPAQGGTGWQCIADITPPAIPITDSTERSLTFETDPRIDPSRSEATLISTGNMRTLSLNVRIVNLTNFETLQLFRALPTSDLPLVTRRFAVAVYDNNSTSPGANLVSVRIDANGIIDVTPAGARPDLEDTTFFFQCSWLTT